MLFSLLLLAGCPETAPVPGPDAPVAEQTTAQAANARGYDVLVCVKPLRDAKKVDATWKTWSFSNNTWGWSNPGPLVLSLPLDDMLCGDPRVSFSAGVSTRIAVQLADMSVANGLSIEYPSPEYKDDDTAPNAHLFLSNTGDDGWFAFTVLPTEQKVPTIMIGTVRPGHPVVPVTPM